MRVIVNADGARGQKVLNSVHKIPKSSVCGQRYPQISPL